MHPYRRLWEGRDLESWLLALADDIALYSPMLKRPFRGRESARELFEALLGAFNDFEITHEFSATGIHAFFWRGTIGRRSIEGADLIRHNTSDEIVEIRVLIRTLVDIATFGAAVGPLMTRRRGLGVRVLTKVLSAPLRLFLATVDVVASRLVQRR